MAEQAAQPGYKQAVVDAADGNTLDADQIADAVRRIDGLQATKAANAQQLIAASGSQGIRLIDDLDEQTLRRLTAFDANSLETDKVASAVETIEELSGTQVTRGRRLLADADEDGFRLVADADSDTVDDVLSLSLDTSGTTFPDDLADQVRVGLAQGYSREHFSTNSWAKYVYPDAESAMEVAGMITRELDELDSNPNVEGAARVAAKEGEGGTGSLLIDLPKPEISDKPVKGAALEIRAGKWKAGDLDSGTLQLSYEPNVDLTDIEEVDGNPVEDIAEQVYGTEDLTSKVRNDLGVNSGGKTPEFDSLQSSVDGGGSVYVEAKNVEKGDTDLSNTQMTVITRTESQANYLNDKFDNQSWFTAKAADGL